MVTEGVSNKRVVIRKFAAVLLFALCLLGQKVALAADWVAVGGNVHFGTTPVCALVLINGQTQFSCDETGRYDMQVPIDDNGMITVMAFADGFAPFRQVVTPEQAAQYPVAMLRDPSSPSLQVEATYEPSATAGRFLVSGAIKSGTIPVCALVLANGQSMFSCDESQGQFSLDVPIDQDGNITLMVFADGFKPYKTITQVVGDTDKDGIEDYLDYDDDNDGIFDVDDICPLNPRLNCAVPTPDTIFADGKEWLQVSRFTNLSWSDIDAVCPIGNGGACSGTLKRYDMEGWTWASASEVRSLFDFYGFGPDSSPEYTDEAVVAWVAAGWVLTLSECYEALCGFAVLGYTRDPYYTGGDPAIQIPEEYALLLPIGSISLCSPNALSCPYPSIDGTSTTDFFGSACSRCWLPHNTPDIGWADYGGWFYRSP